VTISQASVDADFVDLVEKTSAPASTVHLGFIMANTRGIGVRLRIAVRSLVKGGGPAESVRFDLGKERVTFAIGRAAVLNPRMYSGAIPEGIFEDLVDRGTHSPQGFAVESGEMRQGLFTINLAGTVDPYSALFEVNYEIADAGYVGRPFGGFTIDLGEHLRAIGHRRNEGKGR
jgi:hypothetical protein